MREHRIGRPAHSHGTFGVASPFSGGRLVVDDGAAMRADDPVGELGVERDADDPRQLIDALMAQPPAGLPSIIVIGDDDIFGFRPLPAAPPEAQAS
jgi:hypothetical protein